MRELVFIALAFGLTACERERKPTTQPLPPPVAEKPAPVQEVVDGDTVRVDGVLVRLWGIDAPETGQKCPDASGAIQNAGKMSTDTLTRLIGGKAFVCEQKDWDTRYGRPVSICRVEGRDLSEAMVSEGWAIAFRKYSLDYVSQEEAAKAAGRGMWALTCEDPSAERKRRREGGSAPTP